MGEWGEGGKAREQVELKAAPSGLAPREAESKDISSGSILGALS